VFILRSEVIFHTPLLLLYNSYFTQADKMSGQQAPMSSSSESSIVGKEVVLYEVPEPKYTCGPEDIECEPGEEQVVSETWPKSSHSQPTYPQPQQAYAERFERRGRNPNANAYEQHHAPPHWDNTHYWQHPQQPFAYEQPHAPSCYYDPQHIQFPAHQPYFAAQTPVYISPVQPTAGRSKSADERHYDELLEQKQTRAERKKRSGKSRDLEPWPGHNEEVRKWDADVLALCKKEGLEASLKRKALLL
jgi:hypothetical protein